MSLGEELRRVLSEKLLVTGGAGFIGANFVTEWLRHEGTPLVVLDKLTYAGNLRNLDAVSTDSRLCFVRGDIGDRKLVDELLATHRPRAVVNFAAESHVDRSIAGPAPFIETNIVGTFQLIEAALAHWRASGSDGQRFRFLQVSTDEVYGSLSPEAPAFTERSPYSPNSPYAASKAAADHLVRAYGETFGLPVLTTNCSNNYGPFQFPEKLVPLMICNALVGEPLPIYGDGGNVRDWLHVHDHCAALRLVLAHGRRGSVYNIGAGNECSNVDLVRMLCRILDGVRPTERPAPHEDLIRFVADRPGHDRRYAIDARRLRDELGWRPAVALEHGLRQTVQWYLEHADWVADVRSGEYRQWVEAQYAGRPAS